MTGVNKHAHLVLDPLLNCQTVEEVVNVSSNVIASLFPPLIENILQWAKMNCTDTVQDAVAVINPTGDDMVLDAASDLSLIHI